MCYVSLEKQRTEMQFEMAREFEVLILKRTPRHGALFW
jgi:hypothetical protein